MEDDFADREMLFSTWMVTWYKTYIFEKSKVELKNAMNSETEYPYIYEVTIN